MSLARAFTLTCAVCRWDGTNIEFFKFTRDMQRPSGNLQFRMPTNHTDRVGTALHCKACQNDVNWRHARLDPTAPPSPCGWYTQFDKSMPCSNTNRTLSSRIGICDSSSVLSGCNAKSTMEFLATSSQLSKQHNEPRTEQAQVCPSSRHSAISWQQSQQLTLSKPPVCPKTRMKGKHLKTE